MGAEQNRVDNKREGGRIKCANKMQNRSVSSERKGRRRVKTTPVYVKFERVEFKAQ